VASISSEALMWVLVSIIVITIFYASLNTVISNIRESIYQAGLEQRASSTALLASVYSYTISHGYFNPQLNCSVGSEVVCKEEGRIAVSKTYKRAGGGN